MHTYILSIPERVSLLKLSFYGTFLGNIEEWFAKVDEKERYTLIEDHMVILRLKQIMVDLYQHELYSLPEKDAVV